jgi:hypothetical protein
VTISLTHAAGNITVDGALPDVKWLTRFLYPAIRMVSPDVADGPVVRLDTSDTSRAAWRAAHGEGRPRVAFVLDEGPVVMAETEMEGGTYLVDSSSGVGYSLSETPHSVVVHASASNTSGRIAFMRVVREFMHNAIVDNGGAVFHAAAAATPHGAVLILGPKGAGKTTMLARLLGLDGIHYLSNDRVAVPPPMWMAPPGAHPIPTIVGVREGTRAMVPDLAAALAAVPTFTADDEAVPAVRSATGTWYFSPRQFADACKRRLARAAAVSAIVVLDGFGPLSSRCLDSRAAASAVRSAVLGHRAGHVVSDVFRVGLRKEDVRASIDVVCDHLVSSVPAFGVTMPADPDLAALEAMVRTWR